MNKPLSWRAWNESKRSAAKSGESAEARKTATEAICARDEAVRALQDSEQQYRDLTEALPQLLWPTRPDGWHVYFDQKWCAYTGLTLEESYGHGWNHAFHPDDRQRAWERWKQATETGEAYEIEYRLRRADGSYHWVLGRALPLRDASGQVVKWFGTCTDIDDQKRAEEALRDANQRLAELDRRTDMTFREPVAGPPRGTKRGLASLPDPLVECAYSLHFVVRDTFIAGIAVANRITGGGQYS